MMDGKTIRNKLVGSDDERAVSPVIGVILMVAITVILAAVIATLVMDFGDSVEQNANAGVTIEASDGTATVSWTSSGNADSISVAMSNSSANCSTWQGGNPGSVGDTVTMDLSAHCSGADSGTITVTATTDGGSETVVQTEDYEYSP